MTRYKGSGLHGLHARLEVIILLSYGLDKASNLVLNLLKFGEFQHLSTFAVVSLDRSFSEVSLFYLFQSFLISASTGLRYCTNSEVVSKASATTRRAVAFKLGVTTPAGVICHFSRGRESFW